MEEWALANPRTAYVRHRRGLLLDRWGGRTTVVLGVLRRLPSAAAGTRTGWDLGDATGEHVHPDGGRRGHPQAVSWCPRLHRSDPGADHVRGSTLDAGASAATLSQAGPGF